MSNTDKFLDYEGFQIYHSELVERLKDLEYDPSRMFESKTALLTSSNWNPDSNGRIFGLKEGLLVTVDNQIWQLEDPSRFSSILELTGLTPSEKAAAYEDLGWKVIGSTVDFNIDGHILQLTK